MALGTSTLRVLRQAIINKLYFTHDIVVSTTTSVGTSLTDIIDSMLAPSAEVEDYRGAYTYISTQPAKVDSGADINEGGAFAAGDVTLTVDDGSKFTQYDGIQIENEIMLVTNVNVNDLTVTRGIQGTTDAEHADGTDIYLIGPAVGEVARCTNVAFTGSNSYLIVAPSLSCRMVSGQEYEIHYSLHPVKIKRAINEVLGTLTHKIHEVATLIADGSMRATGVTNWTLGNSVIAKDTAVALFGKQSLKVTANNPGPGLAKSNSVYLKPNTSVVVAVLAYITSGDSAKAYLKDITNSDATLATASSVATGWVLFYFQDQLPATCEEVQIWLEATGNDDIVWFEFAVLWPIKQNYVDLPTAFEYAYDIEQAVTLTWGSGLNQTGDANAFDIKETEFKYFARTHHGADDSEVVPHRIYVDVDQIDQPFFLEGRVDYAELTTDASTTVANPDIVKYMALAELFENLSIRADEDEKADLADRLQGRAVQARLEVEDLLKLTQPMPEGTIQGAFKER
jgi:hypothetical protein